MAKSLATHTLDVRSPAIYSNRTALYECKMEGKSSYRRRRQTRRNGQASGERRMHDRIRRQAYYRNRNKSEQSPLIAGERREHAELMAAASRARSGICAARSKNVSGSENTAAASEVNQIRIVHRGTLPCRTAVSLMGSDPGSKQRERALPAAHHSAQPDCGAALNTVLGDLRRRPPPSRY
jgi:hypothetical protein